MNRSFAGWLALALTLLFMAPGGTQAARKPVVVSHDETYVNKTVHFRVSWQAENPVVMVKIFAGREQKEIKIDEYDNKRTRDGYSGEVSAIVELDPSFMESSLAYVIQLEDDVRLKSDPVNGKIQIMKAQDPYGGGGSSAMGMMQPGGGMMQQGGGMIQQGGGMLQQPLGGMMQQPMGGTMQPTGQMGTGSGVEVLNQVAGVMAALDLPPNMGNIMITKVGLDGVNVGTRITDDKGLTGIAFKIYDNAGNLVQQDFVTPTGKLWEGSSKFFNLVNGNYKATIQATDSSGNTTPEKEEFFAITGVPATPSYTGDSTYTTDSTSSTDTTYSTDTTGSTPDASSEASPQTPAIQKSAGPLNPVKPTLKTPLPSQKLAKPAETPLPAAQIPAQTLSEPEPAAQQTLDKQAPSQRPSKRAKVLKDAPLSTPAPSR